MKNEKRRKINDIWGIERYGKTEGCNEKEPCAVYHDVVDLDGVDGVFVDKLSSEYYKCAFFGREKNFFVAVNRGEGAVDLQWDFYFLFLAQWCEGFYLRDLVLRIPQKNAGAVLFRNRYGRIKGDG